MHPAYSFDDYIAFVVQATVTSATFRQGMKAFPESTERCVGCECGLKVNVSFISMKS